MSFLLTLLKSKKMWLFILTFALGLTAGKYGQDYYNSTYSNSNSSDATEVTDNTTSNDIVTTRETVVNEDGTTTIKETITDNTKTTEKGKKREKTKSKTKSSVTVKAPNKSNSLSLEAKVDPNFFKPIYTLQYKRYLFTSPIYLGAETESPAVPTKDNTRIFLSIGFDLKF